MGIANKMLEEEMYILLINSNIPFHSVEANDDFIRIIQLGEHDNLNDIVEILSIAGFWGSDEKSKSANTSSVCKDQVTTVILNRKVV